jgi:hypothetical protein
LISSFFGTPNHNSCLIVSVGHVFASLRAHSGVVITLVVAVSLNVSVVVLWMCDEEGVNSMSWYSLVRVFRVRVGVIFPRYHLHAIAIVHLNLVVYTSLISSQYLHNCGQRRLKSWLI